MMIRGVAVLSLFILLVLVLYMPSAHPPEHFVAQLRVEHQALVAFWGDEPALRILARAEGMQAGAAQASPIPTGADAPPTNAVNGAVSREMASVNQRLFNNPYFRSVDALLLLACHRLATLLEWLPWLAAFMLAAGIDGYFKRLIKAKQFDHHNPEMFALYLCAAIMLVCATVIVFVLPLTVPPLALPTVPLAIAVLLSRALAHYPQRG